MMMITDFKKEVFGWAEEMKLEPNEIHVRGMTRKWASCSSRGRLTFSFELLNKSENFRAKVIVHELLHLKYPNHSKMFTSLLTAYLSRRGIKATSIKL
jgi:hypothetical protein